MYFSFLEYYPKQKINKKEIYPNNEDNPSRASSSFFSSFFSSSLSTPAFDGAVAAEEAGAAATAAIGAAFRASSIFTSLIAATNDLTLTSSGLTPVAFITFFTLSSLISCFNLCNSKAAYTYSMIKENLV